MTSRQRVLATVAHQAADRIPVNCRYNHEIDQRLKAHFGLGANDDKDYSLVAGNAGLGDFTKSSSTLRTMEHQSRGIHQVTGRWPMQHARSLLWSCGVVLVAVALLASTASANPAKRNTCTLTAAGAALTIDRQTGHVTSILLSGVEEMVAPHPAGSETPYGYLEVVDLHDNRAYNPLTAGSRISDWSLTGATSSRELTFTQQYAGAPCRIVHTLRETPSGLRWQAAVRLNWPHRQNRSTLVNWVLPLPWAWKFWGPNSLNVHDTDGVQPFRYVYGHTDANAACTIIPLVGVWGSKAGAAIFSPPDVRKSQITFDVHTQDLLDPGAGVFRQVQDLPTLRIAHRQVGLRPGKDLTLAIQIAAVRPDWRGVLGHYVNTYPELFEPIPQARRYEGCYGLTNPDTWADGTSQGRRWETLEAPRATCVEVHAHFPEYSVYLTPEAIRNPDLTWICKPHPSTKLSYRRNSQIFQEMVAARIYPFAYFHNVHARMDTIQQLFPDDLMRDEQGKPALQFREEPALRAQPDSAFGKHLLAQLRLLIEAYPQVSGFFVDNYGVQKIDFAHDDGVTMVHDRPGYDLNRNHQDIGTRCNEIAHQAGKMMMANKLSTIEAGRGVDMILLEGSDPTVFGIYAFPCANRAFFPLNWRYPDRSLSVERCLQYLLIWGGTPGTELASDMDTLHAYRPLTDAMIGKRWVFDADPLTLPARLDGQIFRIDPQASHACDVVVTVVDLMKSWKTPELKEGQTVIVRLPEAELLNEVTWLGVEGSTRPPQKCEFTRDGKAITVKLPPAGAAGVLRLSRTGTTR